MLQLFVQALILVCGLGYVMGMRALGRPGVVVGVLLTLLVGGGLRRGVLRRWR